MLVKTERIAKPGSQHARFLPVIRETSRALEREGVFHNFKRIVETVKLPGPQDVEMETRKIGEFKSEPVMGDVPKNEKNRELAGLLRKMNGFAEGFAPVERVVAKIMDVATPTFELSIHSAGVFDDFEPALPDNLKDDWNSIGKKLASALETRGYHRADAETPFEHALLSDAPSGFGELMRGNTIDLKGMHTPICLLRKKLSPSETAVLRELEVFYFAFPKFYGLDKKMGHVTISLNRIGSSGKANWLPVVIDKNKIAAALKEYDVEQAFLNCMLVDASPDVGLVEKDIRRIFGGYRFIGAFQ